MSLRRFSDDVCDVGFESAAESDNLRRLYRSILRDALRERDLPMQMIKRSLSIPAGIVVLLSFTIITACDSAEAISALSSAAHELAANRSLAEQYVRDIKASVDTNDPAYGEMMESYQQARNTYNHFLDLIKLAAKQEKPSKESLKMTAEEARSSAVEFVAGATRSLAPTLATRNVRFEKAIVIPQSLPECLYRIPKKYREEAINQLDEVRWRAWGQL